MRGNQWVGKHIFKKNLEDDHKNNRNKINISNKDERLNQMNEIKHSVVLCIKKEKQRIHLPICKQFLSQVTYF